MNQTTPISINEKILELCKEIDPTTVPIFIDVIPAKDSLFNECYGNVAECVKKDGGKIEYGWIIWEIPEIYIEAEFHAVWSNHDGEYIDITPKEDGEKKILFLKDNERKFECYFAYSKNYCHKYILVINGKIIIVTIIDINRDWQKMIK